MYLMNALLELQQVDYLLSSYLETALQIWNNWNIWNKIGTFGTKLEHLEQNWNIWNNRNIWNKIGTFGTKLEHLEQNWNNWNCNWKNRSQGEVQASFVAVLFAANVLVCKFR